MLEKGKLFPLVCLSHGNKVVSLQEYLMVMREFWKPVVKTIHTTSLLSFSLFPPL